MGLARSLVRNSDSANADDRIKTVAFHREDDIAGDQRHHAGGRTGSRCWNADTCGLAAKYLPATSAVLKSGFLCRLDTARGTRRPYLADR